MTKWIDTRIKSPPSNSLERYAVIFLLFKGHVSAGYATWAPANNYQDGEWKNVAHTNGNPCSDGVVLFWSPLHTIPDFLRI